jgi:hypothetical protein
MGVAYERMALPFRDIEDAVGAFGTLGALRHAAGLFAGVTLGGPDQVGELGAIMALTAVFEAGAAAVVAALDDGHFRTGDATLVGLRILATNLSMRLRRLTEAVPGMDRLLAVVADLDTTLGIARGPRLARQTQLGEAALRAGERPE